MFFKNKSRERGFTLTELIVSLAIAVIILTVVILNQSNYIDGAQLKNVADNISLSLQEAQVYGIAVKEVRAGTAEFSAAYGVHVNLISGSGGNNAYILFADRGVRNGTYDSGWVCTPGGASECLEKVALPSGYTITQICEIPYGGTEACGVGRTDVTFARPDPQAQILYFDTSGNPVTFSDPKGVRIRVQSPKGLTRSVIVYNTGQISVE